MMQAKYRYIQFVPNRRGSWACYTTDATATKLGECEFYAPWKQWQFVPLYQTAFTIDCLRDIAHFLGQLPKP